MIFLDTSVSLAWLLTEDRLLPEFPLGRDAGLQPASRMRGMDVTARTRSCGFARRGGTRRLVRRVALVELTPRALARALDAFPGPAPLRTLDALHVAPCAYSVDQGQDVELASYDRRTLRRSASTRTSLAEGEVSELHARFRGTVSALFFKRLAAKAHRGSRA